MRRKDYAKTDDTGATGYTFHFQISDGESRQACRVRVQAPSHQEASDYFRLNWPAIEAMARDNLTRAVRNDAIEIDVM